MALGERRSSRCGNTGSCSCKPAHRRLRPYGRSSLKPRAARKFGSPLSDQAALFRIALLAFLLEDGARKGAPKKACSTHTRSSNRSLRVSHLCGPNENPLFLTLACWNVRTVIDSNKSERPEHRTALISRELGRYQVDIAAPSETRLSDKGHFTEIGGGYTFF